MSIVGGRSSRGRSGKRSAINLRIVALSVLAVMLLAACQSGDSTEVTAQEPVGESETEDGPDEEEAEAESDGPLSVTYSTAFGQFGRGAYVYVAEERGYFEEAGFEVEIVTGSGGTAVGQLIGAGRVDFAPVDFSAIVTAVANEGLPVVGVSVEQQSLLTSVFATPASGIQEPADLEGKVIGNTPGAVGVQLFPLYAERAGINADEVTFVFADGPALPSLLAAGRVDAINQFVVGVPTVEAATGQEITVLPYSQFITELPGNVLATSREWVEERPEAVKRFMHAVNRGLLDAISDPEEAARIFKQYHPDIDETVAAAELALLRDFILTDAVRENGMGYGDPDRLEAAIDIAHETFELSRRPSLDEIFVQGFTGDVPAE